MTEAACKVLVKQRQCGSGMKWKGREPAVLSLRCLTYTTDRWTQFWGKIDRLRVPDGSLKVRLFVGHTPRT